MSGERRCEASSVCDEDGELRLRRVCGWGRKRGLTSPECVNGEGEMECVSGEGGKVEDLKGGGGGARAQPCHQPPSLPRVEAVGERSLEKPSRTCSAPPPEMGEWALAGVSVVHPHPSLPRAAPSPSHSL